MKRVAALIAFAIPWVGLTPLRAILVVGPGQPIIERVSVRVTQVASDDGTTTAPRFGTADEQAAIFAGIDTIWAQAGIDVEFSFASGTWKNTFALTGTGGADDPRPDGDLNLIADQAEAGGFTDANPNVINLFLVQIVPGFSQTDDNTSNGLAFVGANGITLWAGPTLTDFSDGQDVIASVLAHEIGHNLGLDHIVAAENLMQAGGSDDNGERLNASQIGTALASSFSVPVPEPATIGLLAFAALATGIAGRKARAI